MQLVQELLDLSGIGRNRLALRWVSAAEGQIFADTIKELTRSTEELGHFERNDYRLPIAAVEQVLRAPRLRWLTGMDVHVTERGNVYHEKVDAARFQALLKHAALEEYQKALILESLKEGPRSVREMAGTTGLPVYTVSVRLNDLERRGLAELTGYEGSTPKFIRLAA
jgi:F420-non-reducing hydrogenase iron-sulfur subunit